MRQYRCIRKYDHFLPILCTYVRRKERIERKQMVLILLWKNLQNGIKKIIKNREKGKSK